MEINLNGRTVSTYQPNGSLTESEARIVQIIQDWNSEKDTFTFQTSGSTGASKVINISRSILTYSATCTLDKLDMKRSFRSSLICINPHFIGGFMAVIRALIGGHSITFTDPEANPLKQFPAQSFDLVSMVPLQVETILAQTPEQMNQVHTVIIGGAAVNQKTLEQIKTNSSTQFFHSYGMTETASHFALRDLKNQDAFEVIGDAKIGTDDQGCLHLKGTITGNEIVQTTDLVTIIDSQHFEWIGRADHIINSGGLKINPTEVEGLLQEIVPKPYFVTGFPDKKLGNKVVLIIESEEPQELSNFDFSQLEKYHRPKAVYTISQFVYTATEKINRGETLKRINIES